MNENDIELCSQPNSNSILGNGWHPPYHTGGLLNSISRLPFHENLILLWQCASGNGIKKSSKRQGLSRYHFNAKRADRRPAAEGLRVKKLQCSYRPPKIIMSRSEEYERPVKRRIGAGQKRVRRDNPPKRMWHDSLYSAS